MKGTDKQALDLFDKLVDMDASQHAAYLDAHCNDKLLRAQVEKLLRSDNVQHGLLEGDAEQQLIQLAGEGAADLDDPAMIGAFRIQSRLGEGGMAVVYKAVRTDTDFEQIVALKLISPLRASSHWLQRFLQERQILAKLQHPNIARLIDGGLSDEGRPYFAMEYIDGVPVTAYCDQHKFTLRHRIQLLLSVCEAVSYAHRNLVVHRDLKSSNILVDAQGQPKLLDFGIAQILDDEDTSRTQTVQRTLTPDYAAPEQCVGETVTTAVDVYALGNLLFELLCGSRPFASVSGSIIEIERELFSRGAPSFGRALGDLDPGDRESLAAARGLSFKKLSSTLSADLEHIAQQALRLEPDRRYASVDALTDDLRRYLDGQPVRARADTWTYRLRKFIARHPVGVPASAFAMFALVGVSTIAVNQADQARNAATLAQTQAARANETRDFVASLFEFAGPDRSLGDQLTARQLLDMGAVRVKRELSGQPELHADMFLLLASTYGQLGLYEAALPLAQEAADLFADVQILDKRFQALVEVAKLHRHRGNYVQSAGFLDLAEALSDEAEAQDVSILWIERGELAREQADFEQARMLFAETLAADRGRGASAQEIARDLYRLGTLEFSSGDNNLGLDLLQQAAQQLRDDGDTQTTQYAAIQHDIGVMLIQRGELAQARSLLEDVLASRERLLGERHPDVAVTIKELAGIARQLGENADAEALYLAALSINEEMLGTDHPETANNLNSLAVFFRSLGQDDQALGFATRALARAIQAYGEAHPTVGIMTVNVGAMQRMVGELDVALASTKQGLDILVQALGEQHHLVGVAHNALAGVEHDLKQITEAESNYREALQIFLMTTGENHPHVVSIRR